MFGRLAAERSDVSGPKVELDDIRRSKKSDHVVYDSGDELLSSFCFLRIMTCKPVGKTVEETDQKWTGVRPLASHPS